MTSRRNDGRSGQACDGPGVVAVVVGTAASRLRLPWVLESNPPTRVRPAPRRALGYRLPASSSRRMTEGGRFPDVGKVFRGFWVGENLPPLRDGDRGSC